jgi:hypothetical protein
MMRFAAFSAACLMLATPALAATGGDLGVRRGLPLEASLRGIDPATTGSVETASATPAKPPCPPERRIGTGAGFCVIN